MSLMVLDGAMFGCDPWYRQQVAHAQPDPYFFLNISRDLQDYDVRSGRFLPTSLAVFLALRRIADELISTGLYVGYKKHD